MGIENLREVVTGLNTSAGALAVVAAAIDARLSSVPLDSRLAPHANELLDALGLRATVESATAAELSAVLTEIRAFSHINGKLLYASGRTPGWNHSEPELLQSLGAITHNLPLALKHKIAPQLEGLADRLAAADVSFLDVGAGVARLSIEMASEFPTLRVVGVDPWAPSIALARENVMKAGLAERIELRQQGGEQISDPDAFDLAWIASPFMPEEVVPAVAERVLAALRPGGWVLFAMSNFSAADAVVGSLWRFRIRSFGGGLSTIEKGEALLRQAGFTGVRTLPSPPGAVAAIIAGRRATGGR